MLLSFYFRQLTKSFGFFINFILTKKRKKYDEQLNNMSYPSRSINLHPPIHFCDSVSTHWASNSAARASASSARIFAKRAWASISSAHASASSALAVAKTSSAVQYSNSAFNDSIYASQSPSSGGSSVVGGVAGI
jgi:hypothetical protein